MNKFFLALIFVSKLVSSQTIIDVESSAFKKMIGEKNTVLIDLRTSEEITTKGKIKTAQQIDYLAKDAEQKILSLDRSKTYLLYCAGGGRSEECAILMEKNGFKKIVNLEKGFSEWKQKGFEIEK
jgi:rhodanese-related sulfurtransferase